MKNRLPLKTRIKGSLQALLGYERYLRAFAWFKVRTLRWDPREADFHHFLAQMPRDGVVIDVGANLGFLCVPLARRVSEGAVIAFEPLPDNRRTLAWLLRHFSLSHVSVYPWAVGERRGSVEMILPMHGTAREQGLGHVVDAGRAPERGVRFDVPLHALDDVLVENHPGVRVAGIKIDVENYERFVLRGARRILERDRPLVYLELWDGPNRQESFALARELGYDICLRHEGSLVSFDPERHQGSGNFFFVPRLRPTVAESRREDPRASGRDAAAASLHDAWVAPPGRS